MDIAFILKKKKVQSQCYFLCGKEATGIDEGKQV